MIRRALCLLVLAGCSTPPTKEEPAPVPPWARAFGDTDAQTEIRIAAGPAGEIALTGGFSGGVDFGGGLLADKIPQDTDLFVASLDASGAHRWSRAAGGDALQIGQGAAFDPLGNAYFTGYFEGQV